LDLVVRHELEVSQRRTKGVNHCGAFDGKVRKFMTITLVDSLAERSLFWLNH
jgi:hypothetical protein